MDVLKQKKEIQSTEDGSYNALVLEMSLRSSMYATMAIREFTRMDTGKTYQSKLTTQHQKEEDDTKEENVDGTTQYLPGLSINRPTTSFASVNSRKFEYGFSGRVLQKNNLSSGILFAFLFSTG